MKYPEDYINKIICGDCLHLMKGIPDKAVDLVLTDPPYGINRDFQNLTICKNQKHNRKAHEGFGWDNQIPSKQHFYSVITKSDKEFKAWCLVRQFALY